MKKPLAPILLIFVVFLTYILFINSDFRKTKYLSTAKKECHGVNLSNYCIGYLEYRKVEDVIPSKKMKSIIVGLNVPHKPEGELTESQAQQQRASLNKAQEELIKVIPGEFKVVSRYWFIPAMAISVDEEALKFLEESPLVKSIEEDKLMPVPKVIWGEQ